MSGGCRPSTRAVRAGIDRDTAFGAVTPPLVLSSNFSFAGFNDKRRYDYTRSGNPTRDLLGEALAELEGGAGGVVTATGMAAITLVLNALLEPGDRLVVPTMGMAAAGGCSMHWPGRARSSWSPSISPMRVHSPMRCWIRQSWCGSKPRPIHCCASPIFAS
jgi:hypothetical protein